MFVQILKPFLDVYQFISVPVCIWYVYTVLKYELKVQSFSFSNKLQHKKVIKQQIELKQPLTVFIFPAARVHMAPCCYSVPWDGLVNNAHLQGHVSKSIKALLLCEQTAERLCGTDILKLTGIFVRSNKKSVFLWCTQLFEKNQNVKRVLLFDARQAEDSQVMRSDPEVGREILADRLQKLLHWKNKQKHMYIC